jgi:hypothetical protein
MKLLDRLADAIFQPLANIGTAAWIGYLEGRDSKRCQWANDTHEDEQ